MYIFVIIHVFIYLFRLFIYESCLVDFCLSFHFIAVPYCSVFPVWSCQTIFLVLLSKCLSVCPLPRPSDSGRGGVNLYSIQMSSPRPSDSGRGWCESVQYPNVMTVIFVFLNVSCHSGSHP